MIPFFHQTTRTWYDRNFRQPEARIGNVPWPGNSMDTNLIKRKKYCDKRFLDRVINLIPDSGSKAL